MTFRTIQGTTQQDPAPFTVLFWDEVEDWGWKIDRMVCRECGGKLFAEPPDGRRPGSVTCLLGSHEAYEILESRPSKVSFGPLEPAKKGRPPRPPRGPDYVPQPERMLALLKSGEPMEFDRLANLIGCTRKQLTRNASDLRSLGYDIRCASGHYVLKQKAVAS